VSRHRVAALAVACAAVCAPAAWPIPARADTTITVTTLADDTSNGNGCSLREAISNVNDEAQTYGDCGSGFGVTNITFAAKGTVNLGSTLPTITTSVAIDGGFSGGGFGVTLDAQGRSRHVVVAAGRTVALTNMTLANGHAPNGPDGTATPGGDGGSILDNGILILDNVRITGSHAGDGASELGTPGVGGNGGAVAVTSGSASLSDDNVTFDHDGSGQSGINGANGHSLAAGWGGAIYNSGGSVSLVNDTLAYDNVPFTSTGTTRGGGGIYTSGGTVSIDFTTFAGNSIGSSTHPGISLYVDNSARAGFADSIVADGDPANPQSFPCFTGGGGGSISDAGYDLEYQSTCGFTQSTSQQGVDPLLYPSTTSPALQNWAGFNQTIALSSSSPAIDQVPDGTDGCGSTTSSDERGIDRPYPAGGACDLGSYEYQVVPQFITFAQPSSPATYGSSFTVSPTSTSGLPVTVNASGGCTAVSASGGYAVKMTSGTTACSLDASQSGNIAVAPADDVVRTVDAAPASLTVTADDKSITFGQSPPTFTASYSGFVGKESKTSLSGALTFTFSSAGYGPSTVPPTEVGSYAITPGGYSSDNYQIAYVAGTYHIGMAGQTIHVTTAAPATASYQDVFTVAATGGGSNNPIVYSSSGACSNAGAVYTMTSGTGTCTVTFDQAGNDDYTAAPQVTESVKAEKLPQTIDFTSTAPAAALYGDTYTPTATGGDSPNPIVFAATGQCSLAGGTVTMTSAGSCTVTADQAGDDDYSAATEQSQVFGVAARPATLGFTGNTFWSTGSASATTANVTLSGTVTPQPGGTVDLTNAAVSFLLYKSTNLTMSAPDATCPATVSALGVATCTAALGLDNWTVVMQMPGGSVYFTAPDSDPAIITVYAPVAGQWTAGGGWIVDPGAVGHAHFGFSVRNKSGGSPSGQSEYAFQGSDGRDDVVRSNSWSGGGLLVQQSSASFGGKCTLTVIDPGSGKVISSTGNYTFRVDVVDGRPDTYAITVYTPAGAVFHQAGTSRSPIAVGGGAIVVHSR